MGECSDLGPGWRLRVLWRVPGRPGHAPAVWAARNAAAKLRIDGHAPPVIDGVAGETADGHPLATQGTKAG